VELGRAGAQVFRFLVSAIAAIFRPKALSSSHVFQIT
jgi:hypothetical protein